MIATFHCRFLGFHAALLLALCAAGCSNRPAALTSSPADPRVERIDRSLDRAVAFLVKQRAADGTWSSDVYGAFKDPTVLTPLAADALQSVPATPQTQEAIDKAADYLASLVKSDGTVDTPLGYPYYTAALAASALSQPRHLEARRGWIAFLRQRQLTEERGWQPTDKEYGGWGYCAVEPRKTDAGKPAPPLLESNLSATLFALSALHAAGCPADDPALRKALVFVGRCQNFSDDRADPRFDDGGFFFIYDDPVRNKAGLAGTDDKSRPRFRSYGSMTADGLRALRLCGLPDTDARVQTARHWLESNFAAATHPGAYPPEREGQRMAVYYYYTASASQALLELNVSELNGKSGAVAWAETLSDELMKRQRPDGAWENPIDNVRENDPLLCTCLALRALAQCRAALARR